MFSNPINKYTGFSGEYDISGKSCVNLALEMVVGTNPRYRPRSIKTDHCIMIYDKANCIGNSFKLNPANYANLKGVKHDGFKSIGQVQFDHEIQSFGKCESIVGLTKPSVSFFYAVNLGEWNEQLSKY